MAVSPLYTTQTSPVWSEALDTDSGTANLTGLTPSAIAIIWKNMANQVNTTDTTGTVTITQYNPGIIQYQPSATIVANPGIFRVFAWVTFSSGPEPFDLGITEILQK